MDNYENLSTNFIMTECMLLTILMASCGCVRNTRFENLTTREIKTGNQWKNYFLANPPNCSSSGTGNTTTLVANATGNDSITNAGITGVVSAVIADGGATWTAATLTQAPQTTITTNDGSSWGIGTTLVIIMTS